jgi:nucleotide-binding universal stress UspA family protein
MATTDLVLVRAEKHSLQEGAMAETSGPIIVATDFSDASEAALRVAADYARRLEAPLHVFHAVSPGEMDVTRLLADAATAAGPHVHVTMASAGGDAAQAIFGYAHRHAARLIVVGTHGRSGISRLLLGSVVDRLLRHAPCPVLAVPAPRAVVGVPPAPGDVAETLTAPRTRACLACAQPSADLICEPCRALIRGEALEHKQREERAGRR